MRARAEARLKYEQDQEAKRRARWGYREQNFFAGRLKPFLPLLENPYGMVFMHCMQDKDAEE